LSLRKQLRTRGVLDLAERRSHVDAAEGRSTDGAPVEVDMRFSVIAVLALLSLNGCGSGRAVVAKDDPASRAPEPVAAAKAPHAVQGPVASLGVPPGHYPPLGKCRVWMPGTPPGQQEPPCSCFSLMLEVPVGAWVLYRPSSDETVVQVTKYDASEPHRVASVDWYDAQSGRYLRSGKN
jgi:hypothetical protein